MEALMDMVNQFFLHDEKDQSLIFHSFMSTEENAIDVLIRHGFAEMVGEKPLRFRLLWSKLPANT